MSLFQTFILAICFPIFSILFHEITHLVVARAVSPTSVKLTSYMPLRLQINLDCTPDTHTIRLIALSPLLIGGTFAVIAVQVGVWNQLQHSDPYYLHFLIGLNWLLYTCPSPADLQTALNPVGRDTNGEAI